MKSKWKPYLILLVFILINIRTSTAQESVPVGITFGTTTYMISKAEKYSTALSAEDDLIFFQKHFANESYTVYRGFYYNNSCLASEADFKGWHDNLKGKLITPEARYRLYTDSDTFSIISYSITAGDVKQFFPLALQRKNNQWFLFDLKKSEALMNMKMYMTFVEPSFIQQFLVEPESMKKQYIASLYTAQGNLNGDLMMNYYAERYDPSAKYYNLSRTTFHDVTVLQPAAADRVGSAIQQLANEYKIPAEKQALLQRMAREGNYSAALSKIAEWSNTFDVVEITDKFNTRMMAPVYDH